MRDQIRDFYRGKVRACFVTPMTFFAILLTSVVSSAENTTSLSETDFLIYDNQLYLVGSNTSFVSQECNRLRVYAEMYRLRNNQDARNIPQCKLVKNPSPILTNGAHPSYTYESLRKIDALRPRLTTAIDVSYIVPENIWKFTEDKPRDGVCYNSALVDSGLFSDKERSSSIQDMSYLLAGL